MDIEEQIETKKTAQAVIDIERLQKIATCIRQYRNQFKLPPGKKLTVFIKNAINLDKRIVEELQLQFCFIGRLNSISTDPPKQDQNVQEFENNEIKLLVIKD